MKLLTSRIYNEIQNFRTYKTKEDMPIISMQSEVSVFSIYLGVYPLMSIAILCLCRLVLLFKTLQNNNGGDITKTKQTRRVIDVIFSVNTFPLFVLMTLTGGQPAWPPPSGWPKDERPFCVVSVCVCVSLWIWVM